MYTTLFCVCVWKDIPTWISILYQEKLKLVVHILHIFHFSGICQGERAVWSVPWSCALWSLKILLLSPFIVLAYHQAWFTAIYFHNFKVQKWTSRKLCNKCSASWILCSGWAVFRDWTIEAVVSREKGRGCEDSISASRTRMAAITEPHNCLRIYWLFLFNHATLAHLNGWVDWWMGENFSGFINY